jgi:hypothetical protein
VVVRAPQRQQGQEQVDPVAQTVTVVVALASTAEGPTGMNGAVEDLEVAVEDFSDQVVRTAVAEVLTIIYITQVRLTEQSESSGDRAVHSLQPIPLTNKQ